MRTPSSSSRTVRRHVEVAGAEHLQNAVLGERAPRHGDRVDGHEQLGEELELDAVRADRAHAPAGAVVAEQHRARIEVSRQIASHRLLKNASGGEPSPTPSSRSDITSSTSMCPARGPCPRCRACPARASSATVPELSGVAPGMRVRIPRICSLVPSGRRAPPKQGVPRASRTLSRVFATCSPPTCPPHRIALLPRGCAQPTQELP